MDPSRFLSQDRWCWYACRVRRVVYVAFKLRTLDSFGLATSRSDPVHKPSSGTSKRGCPVRCVLRLGELDTRVHPTAVRVLR